jgi:predicted nuclease with TOPRIM domain
VTKVYQNEITSLKVTIEKLQSDFEKATSENEELSKKNYSLVEEIANLKTTLKEVEMAKDLADRDLSRIEIEVSHLKESLNKRDDDFRSSMTSAYAIQKQALEEKTALWHEIK